jgi:hypothetical protein
MDHARVIESALRMIQKVLLDQLEPNRPCDELAVARVRMLIRSAAVRSALQQADSFLAMTLRAVRLVVADEQLPARQRIGELWCILDQPPVHAALSIEQSSPTITPP